MPTALQHEREEIPIIMKTIDCRLGTSREQEARDDWRASKVNDLSFLPH